MSDEKLVDGLKNKNEAILKELIGIYGKLVYSIISRIISSLDSQAIEELTSDTFLELWQNAKKIDLSRGSLKNLICLIARSKALNYWKKINKRKHEALADELVNDEENPEIIMLEEENLQELIYIIKDQKEPTATIFIMRYLYFYSIAEIADKLSMKRSQVDNYLSRGRKSILNKLEGVL